MWKHYFKIAIRNILNDKVYSVINIIGLTVSIACFLLFVFWIRYELSFEECYPKVDRIYQVLDVEERADGVHKRMQFYPAYQELKAKCSFIEESIYVTYENKIPFKNDKDESLLLDIIRSSPEFFQVFSLPCLAGSVEGVKKSQEGVILNEETACKFFGTPQNAIGKSVVMGFNEPNKPYIVYAVFAIPTNTQLQFDLLLVDRDDKYVQYSKSAHYILLKNNYRLLNSNRYSSDKQKARESTMIKRSFAFQPLKEVHLKTDAFTDKIVSNSIYYGDINQLEILAIVSLLILLLAIINYVNTSTARAITRTKEVGVRKVLGSSRMELIRRFLIESFLISLLAVVLAVDVAKLFLPSFAEIVGNNFIFPFDFSTFLISGSVCVAISVLSGGYAAFYLSMFNPIQVLKGNSQTGRKDYLRRALLGVQFTLSIGILCCAFIINRQLQYLLNKDLGFDRSNVYVLDTSLWYEAESFIQELCKNPYVLNATMAAGAPFDVQWGYTGVKSTESRQEIEDVEFASIACDYRFASTFGLQLLRGEFIQPGYTWWQWTEDKSFSIVINESFEKLLGLSNAVGTVITYYPFGNSASADGKIIGVVKDFHCKPLYNKIPPLIINYNPEVTEKLYIKIKWEKQTETLDYIEATYNKMKNSGVLQKNRPFMIEPLDNVYKRMYSNEKRLKDFLMLFSLLSIVLSCMGIFAMILFVIEKRTKEIAIRKINGASVKDILWVFGKEFLLLIGIASCVAIPIVLLLMSQWVEQYVYRATIGWWWFLLSPFLILLITALTTILQIQKAARRNPVEALRSE